MEVGRVFASFYKRRLTFDQSERDRQLAIYKKYADEQIAHALELASGNKAAAARILGADRKALVRRIKRSPFLQAKLAEIDKWVGDYAEYTLARKIMAGDLSASMFWLQAKRNSSEKAELEVNREAHQSAPNCKYTDEQIAAALEKAAGLKAVAAHILGADRKTIVRRIRQSPHLRAKLAEIDDLIRDYAEGNLACKIMAGDQKASMFWLTCMCGWSEKPKATGADTIDTVKPTDDLSGLTRAEQLQYRQLRAKACGADSVGISTVG